MTTLPDEDLGRFEKTV